MRNCIFYTILEGEVKMAPFDDRDATSATPKRLDAVALYLAHQTHAVSVDFFDSEIFDIPG